VFAALLVIAGTAAVAGMFGAVRYFAITVPATTQTHINEVQRLYKEVPAAQLVREWQYMEKYDLDVATHYTYKKLEIEKAGWGRNSLICLAVFAVATGLSILIGMSESKRKVVA
jgi:hypothetical protein